MPGKLTLSFNPNAEDLLRAALWELNSHRAISSLWDATRLKSELHERHAGSITRYAAYALAYLDIVVNADSERSGAAPEQS
jgi:hypothetical protein